MLCISRNHVLNYDFGLEIGMATREIVLDTETTGLDPGKGDRLVEIGCIELFNSIPTGATFHQYLDPERDMPQEAFAVHGLSREFLMGKPKFIDIYDDFLTFLGDAKLVAHNAEFDMKFINAELRRVSVAAIGVERVVDSLAIARRKHPGSPNSLDALCSRYGIDNSRRTKHGALMDAEILAEVYLELCGGRQTAMELAIASGHKKSMTPVDLVIIRPGPLSQEIDAAEASAHIQMIEALGEKAFWRKYL